jgi:Fe(3+) dicitrate transport protein
MNSPTKSGNESVLIPGMGVNHSLSDQWVVLAGINRGVTLNGPSDLTTSGFSSNREESINYEAGLRFLSPDFSFETIGFYSDYENIKGTCSFSSGCSSDKLDLNFDGGKAEIIGLEAQASTKPNWKSLYFPFSINYTRTVSRFKADNISSNEEWGIGNIKKGDPLPYIPQDTIHFKAGLEYKKVQTDFSFLWKSKMADQAVELGRKIIPSYGVIDWTMAYQVEKDSRLYTKVDNVLDKSYLTSLRPFGARGGKPRMLSVGFNQKF